MKKLFTDISYTATSHASSAILALVLQIFVARTVTLREYGAYSAALSLVILVEAVFIARGGEVALQYLGRHWDIEMAYARWYEDRLLHLDRRLNWLVFLGLAAIGAILAPVMNLEYGYLLALGLTIPAQIGYGVYKSIFIIHGRLREQATFEIAYSILSTALMMGAVAFYGIAGLVMTAAVNALIKTQLAAHLTSRYWPEGLQAIEPPDAQTKESVSLFRKAGVHSILRNACMNGAAQADVLILNMARGPEVVALYKAAKTMAAVPVRGAAPAWVALRPRIMKCLREKDIGRLRQLLLLPAGLLLLVGLLFATIIAAWGGNLMVVTYGVGYISAAPALLWLLVGTWVFGAASGWLNFACVISSKKIFGTGIYMVSMCGIVLGGLWYGVNGPTQMAQIVAGSLIVASVLGWAFFMRQSAW